MYNGEKKPDASADFVPSGRFPWVYGEPHRRENRAPLGSHLSR